VILGTPIITSFAIGLDNTGLYCDVPHPDQNCERLEGEIGRVIQNAMSTGSRFYGKIHPYVARAEPMIVNAMVDASKTLGNSSKMGLKVSGAGFSAPEGCDIARVKPSILDLDKLFADFDPGIDDQRVENMEMETSFLTHFMSGLGYWAGAICPAIANRQEDTFTDHYQDAIKDATEVALLALATLRNHPE
jgi:uridine phosphorylase